MKKYLFRLTVLSLLTFPVLALAQEYFVPELTADDLIQALYSLADWLFSILIITCIIFLIIAGFYFVTAQGDPDKVHKARNFVLYALVGIAVAVAAWGLVRLVGEILGVGL